jgi:DUF1009 family protein
MRFDVPVVGLNTIRALLEVSASVLALEAGRCLIMDKEELLELADKNQLIIVGCNPLV